MNKIKLLLTVGFCLAVANLNNVYAQKKEINDWSSKDKEIDAEDVAIEKKYRSEVPPDPNIALPHKENYELWAAPVVKRNRLTEMKNVEETISDKQSVQNKNNTVRKKKK